MYLTEQVLWHLHSGEIFYALHFMLTEKFSLSLTLILAIFKCELHCWGALRFMHPTNSSPWSLCHHKFWFLLLSREVDRTGLLSFDIIPTACISIPNSMYWSWKTSIDINYWKYIVFHNFATVHFSSAKVRKERNWCASLWPKFVLLVA